VSWQESLIDVEDVALGHHTHLTWNSKDVWVYSYRQVHEALISKADLEQVRLLLASRGSKTTGRVLARRQHPYEFTGLVFHRSCGRRMQGTWNHDRAHYRCRYPSEYAVANQIDHPLSVYLREDQLTGQVDTWLAEIFHPDHVEHSLQMLESAQPDNTPALEAARRSLAAVDQKLARHRAALEAGADPALVAGWTREVQKERELVVAQKAALESTTHQRLNAEGIKQLVDSLGGLIEVLQKADPDDKLELYRQLGLKLTYDHTTRTVLAEANPTPPVGVLVVSGGGHTR
jgi:site-specific DNA recombinase